MHSRYLNLLDSGELLERAKGAYFAMRSCKLCPRECGVNRLKGELGFCKTGKRALVSSYNDHHGEEPPISGTKGSGTIFFAYCNMRCIFCQNYPISQLGHGKEISPRELANMMLSLQKRGCHNINLVTPSHIVPQFLSALYIAAKDGLNIPIVYNSSGYDGMESLKLLDGIIDIYLPDIKYISNDVSFELSGAPDYCDHVFDAVKEMNRQIQPTAPRGCASHPRGAVGLLIRHLVLPGNLSGTDKVLEFIAKEISTETYISLMSQYFPAHKALDHPVMRRRVTKKEFNKAVDIFHSLGLSNGWLQEL